MDSTPAPVQPRSSKNLTALLLAAFAVGMCVFVIMRSRASSRPQLDLTNTGSNSVTVVFGNNVDDVPPGKTWHARFDAGDKFTFRPPAAARGEALTVALDTRNVKAGTPPRVAAEVNADVPAKVRFEYR